MEKINFNGKFIPKIMTAAEWSKSNYVPDYGEIIIYAPDSNYSAPRLKVGNGTVYAKNLPILWANPTYALRKEGTNIVLERNDGIFYSVEDNFINDGEVVLSGYVKEEDFNKAIEQLRDEFLNEFYRLPVIEWFRAEPEAFSSESDKITLSWSVQKGTNLHTTKIKCPNEQIIPIANNVETIEITGEQLQEGNYVLLIEDGVTQNPVEKSLPRPIEKITENNIIYYGSHKNYINTIEGLTNKNESSQRKNETSVYSFTNTEAEYIYFLLPKTFDTPKFMIVQGDQEDWWDLGSPEGAENETHKLYTTAFIQDPGLKVKLSFSS